ncbi:MAG: response regulator [Planctomycetota bacterium]|jgi:DNA-binding NtrC family response regulator
MSTRREEVARFRLLLLEEHRHSIDELRDVFTQAGCECEVALDLATARNILQERMMDLVVVNAALSEVDDEALIRELKAHDPDMSVIIYGATADRTEQRRLRRLGAASYLSEASDLKAVARAVQKVLSKRR